MYHLYYIIHNFQDLSHSKQKRKEKTINEQHQEPTTIQRWVNSQLKGKGKRTSQNIGMFTSDQLVPLKSSRRDLLVGGIFSITSCYHCVYRGILSVSPVLKQAGNDQLSCVSCRHLKRSASSLSGCQH